MSLTTQSTVNVLNGSSACAFNDGRPTGDNELPSASPRNNIDFPTCNYAVVAAGIPYGVGDNGGSIGPRTPVNVKWCRNGLLYPSDFDQKTTNNFTFQTNYPPFKTLGGDLSDQKKVLKMFGTGTNFPSNTVYTNDDNTRDYNSDPSLRRWPLVGMSTAAPGTYPDSNCWVRYDLTTTGDIPAQATKCTFGAYIRIPSDDQLRPLNVCGVYIRQTNQINIYDPPTAWVNGIVVKNDSQNISFLTGSPIDATNGSLANRQQWSGCKYFDTTGGTFGFGYNDTANIESFDYHNASDFAQFRKVEKTVDIQNVGSNQMSLSLFFGENQSYLNASGIPSGAALFYEPFMIFE
jgi:hypothetical protein